MIAEIIFFTSLFLLACTYIIYPLLTVTVASLRKGVETDAAVSHRVSVVMPMYNEEKVVREKIERLIALDYPSDKIEIILGSDASTDSTDSIAAMYAEHRDNIRFIRSERRQGKAAMLNLLVTKASGEILVITDANVMPSSDCLRRLVSHFSDERTGLCDAWPVTPAVNNEGIASQEKVYSSFEMRLKNAESRAWGTMTGPYGGFYAVRKNLFPTIPEKILVDDLFVGLNVISNGFNAINEKRAIVTEDIPSGITGQYRRRVRIAAGSFQNLFHWGLFPGKLFSAASIVFFTHKVLRWCSPMLIIALFMTTVILSNHSIFYFAVVFGQVVFLLFSILDIMLLKAGITIKPLRFTTQFLMMNAALLAGMIKAIKGVKEGIWEPTQRV